MNQYQRMVSYLYEYKQGVKGVNVGYVRIEQRGSGCRISLQMRSRNLGQLSEVAVFRQGREGIRYYTIGTLTERNGDYRCRIETESENLVESGINISDVDGIILYQDDTYYVATTWKNQSVRVGKNRIWDPAEPEDTAEPEPVESEPAAFEETANDNQMALEQSDMDDSVLLTGENEERKDGQGNFDDQETRKEMTQISEKNQHGNNVPPLLGTADGRNDDRHSAGESRDYSNQRRFMDGNRERNEERSFTGENRERNEERSFTGENQDRNEERSFTGENQERNEERSFMGENRERNEERSFMGENRERNEERSFTGENRERNEERSFAGENHDRNEERSFTGENHDRHEERLSAEENREQSKISASPNQNGTSAMGQRFPRWGGMPFFRRRSMGNANIPIPQMGEWGNGNRHIAESTETDTGDRPEHTGNVAGQESQISGASQERIEQAEEEAVCRNCPFKRKNIDYGKRILMTFPVMRPFPNDQQHVCVRIEPQDLGCLPMQMWTLANNHFLLQGYYCYRHLIFMETEEQGYALGVPGIYDRRTCRQAERFGFSGFRAICGGKQCEGAFGYWIMPLNQL